MKQSLGLIETDGLTAAIEAADTALKSANVTLVGYELTKGGGMVTVKLLGEVGAINAALDSAKIAASKVGEVYATKVIARIGEGLDRIINNSDNIKKESISIPNIETSVTVSEKTNSDQSINIKVIQETSDAHCGSFAEGNVGSLAKTESSGNKSSNKINKSNVLPKKKR